MRGASYHPTVCRVHLFKQIQVKERHDPTFDRLCHDPLIKEYRTMAAPRAQHIRHIHLDGDMNNNKMERLNGEIRDREKTMRGLKTMETPILKGYQLYHNYFREHEGLVGNTPAEAAGIKIEGQNKWITVIQNASKQQFNN